MRVNLVMQLKDEVASRCNGDEPGITQLTFMDIYYGSWRNEE
jgi:hypothetical protein